MLKKCGAVLSFLTDIPQRTIRRHTNSEDDEMPNCSLRKMKKISHREMWEQAAEENEQFVKARFRLVMPYIRCLG